MGGKRLSSSDYVSLIPVVLLPLIFIVWPHPFGLLDAKIYDLKIRLWGNTQINKDIVHVDVDDKAIKEFGSWPWDRKISADIVKKLTEFGARVIVFDVLYAARGRTAEGNEAFFEAISASDRVISAVAFGITDSPEANFRGDEEPAEAIYERAWRLQIPSKFEMYKVSNLSAAHAPLVPIILRSRGIGHIKSVPDRDGVHRSVPLLITFDDRCVPSLSLAALTAYLGADPQNVQLKDSDKIEIRHSQGITTIPVDSKTRMLIHWQRPWKSFPRYSATELFREKTDPALLEKYRGKIVIVAVTMTGATDFGSSPLSNDSPLSRIHSSALNTMLTQNFIKRTPAWPFIVGSTLFALAFCLCASRVNILYEIIITALVCVAYVFLVAFTFAYWLYEVPIAAPILIFSIPAIVSLAVRGISYESETARISQALQRYLSSEMLDHIIKQKNDIDLSTKRKELTVLFADIVGFSSISETLEVGYLEQFLDDFFEAMTRAVFDNKGTVDKFLGDGVLAFFGEPVEVANHALAAVAAARQMNAEMVPLNEKWSNMGIKEFEEGVRIRIGITTGIVVVGNVGSNRRMEYTVLGSTVNLASRLQGLAAPGRIMISSRTWTLVKDMIKYDSRQIVRVRGFDRDITVYELEDEPAVHA
jgi:adenylate cyclase